MSGRDWEPSPANRGMLTRKSPLFRACTQRRGCGSVGESCSERDTANDTPTLRVTSSNTAIYSVIPAESGRLPLTGLGCMIHVPWELSPRIHASSVAASPFAAKSSYGTVTNLPSASSEQTPRRRNGSRTAPHASPLGPSLSRHSRCAQRDPGAARPVRRSLASTSRAASASVAFSPPPRSREADAAGPELIDYGSGILGIGISGLPSATGPGLD